MRPHFRSLVGIVSTAVLFAIMLVGCRPDVQPAAQTTLEDQKLALEIQQLERMVSFAPVTQFLAALGGLVGLAGLFWTIWQGLKAIQQQARDRKAEEISRHSTTLFSSSDARARLGAIAGLASYINEPGVIDMLMPALALERTLPVSQALEGLLARADQTGMQKIIAANQATLRERACLLGRLSKEGAHDQFRLSLLGISEFAASQIRAEYRALYDFGNTVQGRQQARNLALDRPQAIDNQDLVELAEQQVRLARATGNVIAARLSTGSRLEEAEGGLDLSLANLYGANLAWNKLGHSILAGCVCRHAKMTGVGLEESDLSEADLFDVDLDQGVLSGANCARTRLRQVRAALAKFDRAQLDNAVLAGGNFIEANFNHADGYGPTLNGADFTGATFDQARFARPEAKGTIFVRASLREAQFQGGVFIGADFSEAVMDGTKFNGANLKGARFHRATMDRVDFSGADLARADFHGAQVKDLLLTSARNLDQAIGLPAKPDAAKDIQ